MKLAFGFIHQAQRRRGINRAETEVRKDGYAMPPALRYAVSVPQVVTAENVTFTLTTESELVCMAYYILGRRASVRPAMIDA